MGQKVNPVGLRLILNKKWQSRWYANKKDFGSFLQQDLKIRKYLEQKLKNCAVAKIQIERPAKKAQVTIYSARPWSCRIYCYLGFFSWSFNLNFSNSTIF